MSERSTEYFLLTAIDVAPNNDMLPFILYKAAVQFGEREPEGVFEDVFWGNAWADGFRDGTFPFHHYHSAAHEVVGIARGTAVLQFGGPTGPVVEVKAGDAAVIPAGVVHRRIDDAPGFSVVGAHPCFFSSFRINFNAALAFRFDCTRKSKTSPSLSTARHNQ